MSFSTAPSDKRATGATPSPRGSTLQEHRTVALESNRASAELQKKLGQERDGRVQVEAALVQQQAATTWWQSAATLLSVAAIALVIVGIIIGSAARDESER